MEDLIELGAVEVADDYRGLGLGKRMIRLAFADDNWRTSSFLQPNIIGIGILKEPGLMYGNTAP